MKRFSTLVAGAVSNLGLAFLISLVVSPVLAQDPGGSGLQVKVADAKSGDSRLIVSGGFRGILEAVKGQAEEAVGHPFIIQYGASKELKATIESGQPFEVAIVTPEVLDEMIAKGRVVAGSRFDIGRVLIGIGQRGNAPKSNISTPAALKQTLLNARSIRFGANGAAYPGIMKMLESLGISEMIKEKVNIPEQAQLAAGDYELTINLASEIVQLKNLVYLGEIPRELNTPTVMAAGIGSAGDQRAAKALIRFLQRPGLDPVLTENRMQR